MRKSLLLFSLLFFVSKLFAQDFAQYNTGTLYDSFENPAQRTFIPDSSRKFAFNMFVPNFDGNFYIAGDAQRTLKDRAFKDTYNNQNLVIGPANHYNYLNANANAYTFMFKVFTSLDGNSELGIFEQARDETRGVFTDESVAFFNGDYDFKNSSYTDVFNSRYQYQIYSEAGFTYREQITKEFAFGIKLAYVAGYSMANVDIEHSQINYDKTADTATLQLQGTERETYLRNAEPFNNPGVSVSLGSILKTPDGYILQANIKDLGFIHWERYSAVDNFNTSTSILDLTSPARETAAYGAFDAITSSSRTNTSFNTPIDGHAELSVSKLFYVDDNDVVTYSPTLIASKELFYTGFTAALVNPVSYKNYTFSLTGAYNDMKLFDFGAQFMVKSANAEFFIGSDRVFNSLNFAEAALKSNTAINSMGAFTGADITIGFSMKFGPVIEHPMNASTIPMGDDNKGFLGRLWNKVFNPNAGTIQNN